MDALVAAAKKEGELNVIALPPDWANYGEIIKALRAPSTASRSTPPSPTRASQDEINAAKQLKGTDRAPDVFDLGQAVALANTDLFAPYKVATWDDIPDELKDAERRLGQRLRRLHVDRLRLGQGARAHRASPTCSSPSTRARSPSTVTRPRPAPRFSGVHDGRRWPTAARPTTSARASTSSASSRRPATSCRSTRPRRRSSPARPRSSSTGTTSTPPQTDEAADLEGRRPGRTPSSAATTSRRSTRTPRTRRPPGCGRSSSTPTRARTSGSRAAPGRSAADAMAKAGTIDKAACDALPAGRPARRSSRPRRRPTKASDVPRRPTGPRRSAERPCRTDGGGHGRRRRSAVGCAVPRRLLPFLALRRGLPARARRSPWSSARSWRRTAGSTLANVARADRAGTCSTALRQQRRALGGHRRARGGARRAAGLPRRHRPASRVCCAGSSISLCGVLAQFGGVTLAFAFIATIGLQRRAHRCGCSEHLGVDLAGSGWLFELPGPDRWSTPTSRSR